MGLKPVLAEAGIGNEGNGEADGALHLFEDDFFDALFLFWIDGEVEFVVDLQDHLRTDALGLETVEDTNHGYLDDISRRALYGGVDGIALSEASDGGIVGVDIGQVAATAE